MKKQYYKVVREIGGNLFKSATSGTGHTVGYELGKWTQASLRGKNKGNPFLFVFTRRKDARIFKNKILSTKIFKCEVGKICKGIISPCRWGINFIKFNNKIYDLHVPSDGFPEKTFVTDSVKLIEEIR